MTRQQAETGSIGHTAIEPKPVPGDEIFLSPRVVDGRAFAEYAAELRTAIERTTRESDLLARRAEAAAAVLERLEGFVGTHTDVFDRASRLIESIDERQAATSDLLNLIERRTEAAERTGREIERAAAERADAFGSRLRSIVDAAMDRFEETEDQLSSRAASMRRDLLTRLDELRTAGEKLIADLELQALASTEDATRAVTDAETRLAGLTSSAETLAQRLDVRMQSMEETINEAGVRARRELGEAEEALQRAIAEGTTHEREMINAAERGIARVESTVADQVMLLDQMRREARQSLEANSEAMLACASEAEARARSARDSAAELLRAELDQHRAQVSAAAAQLAEAVRAADAALRSPEHAELLGRHERAIAEARESASLAEGVAEQTEIARRTLDEAVLSACERIDALSERADGVDASAGSRIAELAALIDRLAPWDELLDSTGPDIEGRVASAVRSETRTELEAMSEALAALTERVVKAEKAATARPTSTTKKKAPARKKPTTRKKAPAKKSTPKPARG